ncbi:MAG TPA: M1 family peptidase, partial [Thauera sp.]|nr:M1 family peptidase [Thauera sp.]
MLLLCGLLMVSVRALAAPQAVSEQPFDIHLDVRLDPATRVLAVRAELQPAEADFRFLLHEGLQPSAASAAGRSLQVQALGQRGSLRA